MMAPHVEANSLSDITQLAGNPPKYPRNPTEQKRPSLTLYIARVPGTRDIILTTLKPQLKNVTAEDVASSLYYLHLNTEEDARFLEEEQNAVSEAETNTPLQKPFPRKPLPESARSSLDLNRQLTSVSINAEQSSKGPAKRKPVPGADSTSKPLESANEPKQSPLRRPLGPRPLLSETSFDRKPLPGTENQPFDAVLSSQIRTSSPSRISTDAERNSRSTHLQGHIEIEEREPPAAFTITLIRRDPSSGSQWNIGTISGRPVAEEGQDRLTMATPQPKKPYFDMSIHLTTPGYSSFRNSHLTSHVTDGMTGPRSSLPSHNAEGFDRSVGKHAASSYGFYRQVRMEGSSFWSRTSVQHKRTKSDISVKGSVTRGRSSSGNTAFGVSEALPSSQIQGPHFSDSQAKGYTFLSPWGGRCKFSTSSSGRSLRCKHTLPEPVSASIATESSPPAHASVSVSEIRFNLPSAAVFNAVTSAVTKKSGIDTTRFSIPKFGDIRNRLSSHKSQPPLPPRPHPDSYAAMYPSDDETPPLPPRPYPTSFTTESSEDETSGNSRRPHPPSSMSIPKDEQVDGEENIHLGLALGQEMAGGGNRGKRAKLGKLIIHDEGFKMLDLVVSANMAVWWSVWESHYR